jgi:hypothetical protein
MAYDSSIQMILDVWQVFKEHVPSNHQEDAAIDFLHAMARYETDLEDLRGEDDDLDNALDLIEEEGGESELDFDEDE